MAPKPPVQVFGSGEARLRTELRKCLRFAEGLHGFLAAAVAQAQTEPPLSPDAIRSSA
jgi:hypothetical protein